MVDEANYDVCIIGAGVAGALVAYELGKKGLRVLVFDAGLRFDRRQRFFLMRDAARGKWPWTKIDPDRRPYSSKGGEDYRLPGKTLQAVGGSTHHWGGVVYRLHESDFRLRRTYRVGEDWPIDYAELEPFYAAAEKELGVSGQGGDPFASYRSGEFPLPAFPLSHADQVAFKPACDKLGIALHPISHARNSVPHQDRPACQAFGLCHVCPIEAMYNAEVHIRLAERTGNVRVVPETRVIRINPSTRGHIGNVTYTGRDRVLRQQSARVFVLAAHTVESVRLLLLSASGAYPRGLANDHDLVGRFFMEHFGAGMTGTYKENLFPHRIGFNTAHSLQFYDTPQRNRIGAIKLTFSSGSYTPAEMAERSRRWGIALKREIRDAFGRAVSVVANVEQLPQWSNRVALDASLRDEFGLPAPEIHLTLTDYETRTLRHARTLLARILRAMEAPLLWSSVLGSLRNERHPIAHHMGGCRMGDDATRSVVDRNLQVHGIDNLFVVGSSVFPTAGAVNPTLTIAALALRAARTISKTVPLSGAKEATASRS